MALLNYTTQVAAAKTVGEIIGILTAHGARAILQEYDDHGTITDRSFQIYVGGQELGFRLPADWRAVLPVMERDRRVPRRFKQAEQARRVAWRILKDWIAAQMALIEVNLATMEQVFLPYAILADGRTVDERLREQRFALPPHDTSPEKGRSTRHEPTRDSLEHPNR
jgi:hypothetical protein